MLFCVVVVVVVEDHDIITQVFFVRLQRESCSFESCLLVLLLLLFLVEFVDSIKESKIVTGRLDGRFCWLCDTVEVAESPQVFWILGGWGILPFGVFACCLDFLVEFRRFDQGVENRYRSFARPGLLVVRCSRGVLNLLKFLDTWSSRSSPLSDCSSKAQFWLVELS